MVDLKYKITNCSEYFEFTSYYYLNNSDNDNIYKLTHCMTLCATVLYPLQENDAFRPD